MGAVFKWVTVALSVLSPFVFPAMVTIVLLFVVALFIPLLALIIGMVFDALYYVPSAGVAPYGTLGGLVAFIFGSLMRRFVKTRMMSS